MTPEQKQQILRDAPEGATHYSPETLLYYRYECGCLYYRLDDSIEWYLSRKTGVAKTLITLDSLREPEENWSEEDEKRMDVIGSNGNSAYHYAELEKQQAMRPEVKAQHFLEAGIKHMADRAKTYDKPEGERSMGATVKAFEAATGITLTEEQGWLFQVLLKAVRSQQGDYKADNYEDGAAYFALTGEAASKERVK